jgi:hypothetical protein
MCATVSQTGNMFQVECPRNEESLQDSIKYARKNLLLGDRYYSTSGYSSWNFQKVSPKVRNVRGHNTSSAPPELLLTSSTSSNLARIPVCEDTLVGVVGSTPTTYSLQ